MKKVLYEELLPEECVQRIKEMPVAYLPLGTLEWHGPHMPLGADGIQSKELGASHSVYGTLTCIP